MIFGNGVYREGNGEADHETHVAREGFATTDVRWDHNTLNSICMGHYSVHTVRGSFDGGRCELCTSCGWVIDICISSNLSSSSLPPGLPPNRWHLGVARRAFMIPSHCTVTQAELAASQSLLSGVVDLCTYIYIYIASAFTIHLTATLLLTLSFAVLLYSFAV